MLTDAKYEEIRRRYSEPYSHAQSPRVNADVALLLATIDRQAECLGECYVVLEELARRGEGYDAEQAAGLLRRHGAPGWVQGGAA